MPAKANNIQEQESFVLGSELRDAIARPISRVIPNIQFKQMSRLVSEFEIEIANLNELQQAEEK